MKTIPLTDGEKYSLAIVTTLMTQLKHNGVITEKQGNEIIQEAQFIWMKEMSKKHEDFGK